MKHLGDITKINGADVPIVDCVIGGSPCQDLSVAGKRAGLAGERSGLYMEQIRIIKEMREYDRRTNLHTGADVRPRFMVWENVPGAFSSNRGDDFRAVLEEAIKVAEPKAPILPLPENGKWSNSGCIYDEMGKWSVAWRVHDAQFWGVPQRRRRISLVADFGGRSAPEICFERESVSGNIEPCGEARQGTTRSSEECSDETSDGESDLTFSLQGSMIGRAEKNGPQGDGINENVSFTLNTTDRHAVCYDVRISSEGTINQRAHCYKTDISRCLDSGGENPDSNHGGVCVVKYEAD